MSGESPCSARPSELVEYARETDDVVRQLRAELHNFDLDIERYLLAVGGPARLRGYADGMGRAVFALEDMAAWVSHVGWAFAIAGGDGDATTTSIVSADPGAVDHWLDPIDWNPREHLRGGQPGDWLRALDPRCRGFAAGSGYRGSGFIVGPDGRSYPLVAPYVTRDGVEYHADDGLEPGKQSVLDLDGRDAGWTTVYEKIGVERWRDAPDLLGRLASGAGATVAGGPNGSSRSDVEALAIAPGLAPTFRTATDRASTEPGSPPYMRPAEPPYAPPARPDTRYPDAEPRVGKMNAVTIGAEFSAGAFMADQGSHAGYDVTFQQNADGRRRALYKRVYVGFDAAGKPYADSVWVTGSENNDHVLINYAP